MLWMALRNINIKLTYVSDTLEVLTTNSYILSSNKERSDFITSVSRLLHIQVDVFSSP